MPFHAGHILGRYQGIHDGFLSGLHRRLEDRIQRVVREHRNRGSRTGRLRGVRVGCGECDENVTRPVARDCSQASQPQRRATCQPLQLRGKQRSIRCHHDDDGSRIFSRADNRGRGWSRQLRAHRRAGNSQLPLGAAIALHQRRHPIGTSHAGRRSNAALESKANHSGAAADVAFRHASGRRAIHGLEHMRGLYVKSVDVVQKAVPRFRNNWERPEIIAGAVGGPAFVFHLPGDGSIAHHAHAVSVGDEDGACQEPGFFEPGGPGHLTVTVLREPAAERRIVRLLAARPDHSNAGADGIAFNQGGVSNFDAGDIGDGVPSSRRAIERDAQIASPFRLGQQRNSEQEHSNQGSHLRKSRPVISFGCFSPRNSKIVGEISCSAPPCRKGARVSSTRMNGTGFVVW